MKKEKTMRRILAICVLFVCVFSFAIANAGISIPDHTSKFYVNDFADLFSDEQEKEMLERAVALAEKPEGVQVVVSTVKTLDGSNVEDYANQMYKKYAIGRDSRGILILLSVQERKVRVEVGYGLESVINDAKAGNYIRTYAIDYLKQNQFAAGLMNLQKALVKDLDAHYESKRAAAEAAKTTKAPVVTEQPATRSVASTSQNETKKNNIESSPSDTKKSNVTSSQSDKGESSNLLTLIGFAGTALMAALALLFGIKYKRSENSRDYESSQYDKKLSSKEDKIASLNQDVSRLNSDIGRKDKEISSCKDKYEALKDRYNRAKKLHEGLDSEIDAMIQKEIDEHDRAVAADFDRKYSDLTTDELLKKCMHRGSRAFESFEEKYSHAFSVFSDLNKAQKGYIKTNMAEMHRRFDEGMCEKSKEIAKEFNETLRSVTNQKGKEDNLRTFERTQSSYDDLDEFTKGFVDASLISVLSDKITAAQKDREARIEREEEEAAERRRRSSYYSSYSYSSCDSCDSHSDSSSSSSSSFFDDSSSFSGFGGDSGGGGASADF